MRVSSVPYGATHGNGFARLSRWPETPTRYLLCLADRMFPAAWARRHARERLGVDPDEINGGHYISLSCPLELAARLAAYAAKTH